METGANRCPTKLSYIFLPFDKILSLFYLLYVLDFRSSKGSDILQMLVSIYDSKDLFVKELQILLAQRLLAVRDYDLDREVCN